MSSASDILQTTTSQRPRAARGQTDAQHGQDFSALVESNVSADKAAQQPAATDQSERRTEDSRASQADRSSNAQTENAHNRREQARATRNRDDRSTDAATRRDVAQEAAHETGAQTADPSGKTRAGETSTQENVRDTADEADLTAEQNADAGADAPATDMPSAITIAVTLNPETALTSEINTPGAESDAAIADALNAQGSAKNAEQQTAFAQLASEAATQDAAISDDAAKNSATQDQPGQAATDSATDTDPSTEAAKATKNAARDVAATDGDDTGQATKAVSQDAIAQAAISAASRRDAKKAQAELRTDAANRVANSDDTLAAGEQSAATSKTDQTDAALIANAGADAGARAGRGAVNREVNRGERSSPSDIAPLKTEGTSPTDAEAAILSDAGTNAETTDANDNEIAASAQAAKAGTPHLAAERAAAANHALALQAALADSVAGQAQSSFANPVSAQAMPGGLQQPILQNVALFDVSSASQPGGQASGQAVAVSGLATEIVARSRDGSNRFEIRLDPAELGRIDVRLDVDKHGNVSSRLIVERTETLDMLRRDAAGLERALQDAGLKTSDNGLQFSLRDQNSSRQQDDQSQNQRHARLIIADEDSLATAPAGQTYGRMLGNAGGLDIRV